MILRRILRHFRKQEWTAIAIDFVIVVMGVFVGVQASNLNAARAERVEEARIIERLHAEFVALRDQTQPRIGLIETYARRTGKLIDLIRAGGPPASDKEMRPLLDAVWSNSGSPQAPAGFLELINSGSIARLSDPGLRAALTRYAQRNEVGSQLWSTMFPLFNDPRSVFRQSVRFSTDLDKYVSADPQQIIVGYDWEMLKQGEAEFENIQSVQWQQYENAVRLLDAIDGVIAELEKGA